MQKECTKATERLLEADNPLGLPLAVGQIVHIETLKGVLLRQTLGATLPPVLGFLAGTLLTGWAVPGEGARFLGGTLFFFVTAYFTYRIRKKHPAETALRVVRIAGAQPEIVQSAIPYCLE
jgi:positive regulator of sigma E activity